MDNTINHKPSGNKPDYVALLEASYGAPNQNGFGSAVFFEVLKMTDDLGKASLEKYKFFVGDLWKKYGEKAWMGPWKEVYARKHVTKPDVVSELSGIQDSDASLSTPMILDVVENAEKARLALSKAFDNASVSDLRVYNLGDGGAMSGLLVAGRRINGETTFLVFLMD
jgi:hypothetical protein